jgi:LDH2 family malate/lactate/ureidoglycolate dehydrogenase
MPTSDAGGFPAAAEDEQEQPRRTRVVVITGPPGVGKTETSRRLVRRYFAPAALIDTDTVADIYPWQADERLYSVLGRNLRGCLASYRAWGARIVVISGVLLPGRSLDQFADLLADPTLEWVFYGLSAGPDELAARIRADPKMQESEDRLSWSHLDREVSAVPGIRLIDTRRLGLEAVVDLLADQEAADLPPGTVAGLRRPEREPNAGRAAGGPCPNLGTAPEPIALRSAAGRSVHDQPGGAMTRVPVVEAEATCRAALTAIGFTGPAAERTAQDLVAAEAAGLASHGLLRVPEYAQSVRAGHLLPGATPVVTRTGDRAFSVDGRRAPGTVVRHHLIDVMVRAGTEGPVVVGLKASGHLGRLAPLAAGVAAHGLALIGFVNYSGAGQKVAPEGGTEGLWGTNPVVMGCPAPPGPPMIADMSTSVVSEGTVRSALLAGRELPPGLLVGPNGEQVTDPRLLYSVPPRAALLPAAGHKGHAWAAFAEVLAGIVAGAGHLAEPQLPGNGGLFITFPTGVLGRSSADVSAAAALLEERLRTSRTAADGAPPRLPGRGAARERPHDVLVPVRLWRYLSELGESAAATASTRPFLPSTH